MASFDYTPFVTVAQRVITDFGAAATLTHKVAGTYNPSTSQAAATLTHKVAGTYNPSTSQAAANPTVQDVKAVAFPYPEKLIDGTMILTGDKQVFLAPSGVTPDPRPADKFTQFGISYDILDVKIYNPGGVTVLYELQVRK
jgi:hypothetical protein